MDITIKNALDAANTAIDAYLINKTEEYKNLAIQSILHYTSVISAVKFDDPILKDDTSIDEIFETNQKIINAVNELMLSNEDPVTEEPITEEDPVVEEQPEEPEEELPVDKPKPMIITLQPQ